MEPDAVAIGAANVDIIGKVDEFPGEDEEKPVDDFNILPGGAAANVAVEISRLGFNSGFIGRIGGGQLGRIIKNDFKSEGVDFSQAKVEGKTGLCAAFQAPAEERRLLTFNDPSPLDLEIPEDYLRQPDYVYISSVASNNALQEFKGIIGEISGLESTRLVFDPGNLFIEKGLAQLEEFIGESYAFLASQSELENLFGKDYRRAGKEALELGAKVVVVTRGEDGSALITSNLCQDFSPCKLDRTEIEDTVGAGDAFSAGLIASLLGGDNLEKAVKFGNYVAAESLKGVGARSVPRRTELESGL